MWWRERRRLLHLVKITADAHDDHLRNVTEAQNARRESRRDQAEVEKLSTQVADMSSKLEYIGRRNHLSELVEEMLRAPRGGPGPASRRG